MNSEIKLNKEHAQRIFDALASSMDFGSGFLETEDVEALRALAVAIGVDPNKGTPDEFKAQYPHPFKDATDRVAVAATFGALSHSIAYGDRGIPYAVHHIDQSKMPDYAPCMTGPCGRKCAKPVDDPIHRQESDA